MTPRNLAELHRVQAERLGPRPALRYKQHGLYHDYPWSCYRAEALACAASLVNAGIKPGDRVGLFAENRREWLVADMGILTAGAVNVTPHAPLTPVQVQYELADSGCSWLLVSTQAQLDKVLQVRDQLSDIRGIVTFDSLSGTLPADVCSWDTFVSRGRQLLPTLQDELAKREAELNGESLATIMYTSGTTGKPKGVMLTHGNLLSNAKAVLELTPPTPGDVLLSWLPYSHIYARTVDHYRMVMGGALMYLAESIDTLVTNLAESHPTHMNAVPRFYEKVLANHGAKALRHIFGPRVKFLSSGGAPLPHAIAKVYQEAGLLLLQGYGLTESSPVISFNCPERYKLDTVGRALPGVEIRIADDGEVLSRGPHIMKGYWKKPDATAEAIRDGWLHTGDIGTLDADGFLSITGRKKELMVLSSGKKVVPPYLEGLILGDPCIDQIMIVGEGKNFLTALVVPAWDRMRATLNISGDEDTLSRDPRVHEYIEKRLSSVLKDVTSWEQVKKFVVLSRPFTVAAEELTVSLKMRRGVILDHNRALIDELYRGQ
jgi:long-chain acyl-CoA synthetase